MRIPEALVGTTVGPLVQEIDARWLMAYAAALGDVHAEYLDTTRPEGVIGHPVFPVCYEWPLAVELRASALPESIAVRSVHATHDVTLHRPLRAHQPHRAYRVRRAPGRAWYSNRDRCAAQRATAV
jgi:hypothetical protein